MRSCPLRARLSSSRTECRPARKSEPGRFDGYIVASGDFAAQGWSRAAGRFGVGGATSTSRIGHDTIDTENQWEPISDAFRAGRTLDSVLDELAAGLVAPIAHQADRSGRVSTIALPWQNGVRPEHLAAFGRAQSDHIAGRPTGESGTRPDIRTARRSSGRFLDGRGVMRLRCRRYEHAKICNPEHFPSPISRNDRLLR